MRLNYHGGPFKNVDDAIKIQGNTPRFWDEDGAKRRTESVRKRRRQRRRYAVVVAMEEVGM
ncbi:hypothetical protein E2C01_082686 [Portunus trituberculatus]|uniref:Uncharacterized protein n=1 Tax=Portunus trituberculatus TaxID=210409 RepID=A0A5B7ISZ8_PORTR|nr:hypothetical protein [Portunus trituberculatus]